MKLLNLGCGQQFHKEWTNLDFSSDSEYVTAYNLLKGIPFKDNSFDVVYHSHLLEHFSKKDGEVFIKECFRVLKQQGIIRIAVPDLETIALEYLRNLNRAIDKEPGAEYDYDWILLEMYDQTVRNISGGEMANYFYRKEIPNKDYVFNRIGFEGKNLHCNYLNSINGNIENQKKEISFSANNQVENLYKRVKNVIVNKLLRKENEILKKELKALQIGQFRLSGEIHQHMYDRYSISKLLAFCGFKNIKKVTSVESDIKDWNRYQLDSIEGITRKPDSLFIEAVK